MAQPNLLSATLVWLTLIASGHFALSLERAHAETGAFVSAWTKEQVEADWLHADLLRTRSATVAGPVTPEEDARGGCDGQISGRWGFHTAREPQPWWQVDLGHLYTLKRVVLHNRGDSCGERNRFIKLLVSKDGENWEQVYQHDGTMFFGGKLGPPLTISLRGITARWVRVQLPGTDYLHLDEVEVYALGQTRNIALGCEATQSSVSPWSVRHPIPGQKDRVDVSLVKDTIHKGTQLARKLAELGVDTRKALEKLGAFEKELARWAGKSAGSLPAGRPPREAPKPQKWNEAHAQDDGTLLALYQQIRWTIRDLAFSNPLLDFHKILFVKRAPPAFPHMSDQYYGWWIRPGGGIYVLENFKSPEARVRSLTEGWPTGSFLDPDISYDGGTIVFSFARYYPGTFAIANKVDKSNLPEDSFYHLYEMTIDGREIRKLTWGKYDHFSPRYLPSGDIVFLSTRKGLALAIGPWSYRQELCDSREPGEVDARPDSYVRCGGDNWRPVPVFTLHRMDAARRRIWPISAFENFEWTPAVAPDGRIFYARWDYIDRFNGPFMSLWSTNPDGTNPQLVYGNFTYRPQCVFEARPVPGSAKWLFVAAAHHSILGGSLVLLDRARGTEFDRPIERVTPEVCFPETEGWPDHYFVNPYPLSEDFYLVAWSDRPLPQHSFMTDERNPVNPTGIYLLDRFGNMELLYRDPEIGSFYPLPIRPRPMPAQVPDRFVASTPGPGYYFVKDVYRGSEEIPRGTIREIRIVGVPPKVQPHMNVPPLGVSKEDPGKYVIGSVPVAEDGSAYFAVPGGVPVFFQLVDADGFAVRTMRSLTYVQPGQTLGCVGCHEGREEAPAGDLFPQAMRRPPVFPEPGPEGSWPLRYDRMVQPVLDRHCVECHQPEAPTPAAAFDLRPEKSYDSLLQYANGDLAKLAHERDHSLPGDCPARQSRLVAFLQSDPLHRQIPLCVEDWTRLTTWMDTYAQRQGHFSVEQEQELEELRKWWSSLRPHRAFTAQRTKDQVVHE